MTQRRSARDALVGAGAAIVALGLVLLGVAELLRLIDEIQVGFAPTSYMVGRGFDLAHDVALGGAFAIACVAFLGSPSTRERRLMIAAVVAACAFVGSVVAQCLYAAAYSEHKIWTQLVVSYSLGALGALVSVAAAVAAAAAFRGASTANPADQSQRDGILGWSAAVLAIGLSATTASAIVYVDILRPFGTTSAGLWIATAGGAVAIIAGALAAVGLLASRRDQRHSHRRWMLRRDALLAIAISIFFVSMALQGIGAGVTASAEAASRFEPGLLVAAYWLAMSSALVACAGAACAAVGFLNSAVSSAEPAHSSV